MPYRDAGERGVLPAQAVAAVQRDGREEARLPRREPERLERAHAVVEGHRSHSKWWGSNGRAAASAPPPPTATRARPIQREAGARLPGELAARVVLGDELRRSRISSRPSAVSYSMRRSGSSRWPSTIGSCRAVGERLPSRRSTIASGGPVPPVEKRLVVALEFVVEDDARHASAVGLDARGFGLIERDRAARRGRVSRGFTRPAWYCCVAARHAWRSRCASSRALPVARERDDGASSRG